MRKIIKAVIFDWAGTTIDYGCFAPVQGFIDGFESVGIDITNEMIRQPMGLPKLEHVKAISAMLETPLNEDEIQQVYEIFEISLLVNLDNYCEINDYVLETIKELKERSIHIGSTTGYTAAMIEKILPRIRAQGYEPEYWITPEQVSKARPYPYMIWSNMMHFEISDPKEVIKIGDTIVDIEEGKNADCWTVGIIMGSSLLGLSKIEVEKLSEADLKNEMERVRAVYYQAGADYIIDDLSDLPSVIDKINNSLRQNHANKLLTPSQLTTRKAIK